MPKTLPDSFFTRLDGLIEGEIHTDGASLAAYASDASNHRVVPRGVITPRTVDDLSAVVRSCAEEGVPITSRGAGTNVAGNAIGAGVVIDYSRHLNRVISVDPQARIATVQPGAVLDHIQTTVALHGLRFGPDPSTHNRCTIGGMIGTNACGSHSVAWGTTADNVVDLEVMQVETAPRWLATDTGLAESLRGLCDANLAPIRTELGQFARQMSGYGLHHLLPEAGTSLARAFTGSEGTLGIVTGAQIRLVEPPASRALVVLGFPSDIHAAAAAPGLIGTRPLTVEGIDEHLVRAFDTRPGPHRRPELPQGNAWLLVEVGGLDPAEVREHAARVVEAAPDATGHRVLHDYKDQRSFWTIRERGAGLATRTAEGVEAWPGWEDSAVPPARLAAYLREFHKLMANHGRQGIVYGHFGEGCLHVRVDHDLLSAGGRANYRRFQEDAADLVVAHDGSLTGEHGDGRARSELLDRMYSPGLLRAFGAFKHIFDPDNLFNPGIITDPEPMDANLRLELSRPHVVDLQFGYREDDGDFGKAMRRCVGVGACRKTSGGGMCPSYRATQDERHSTRGRARILFEMLEGHLGDDGWRSRDVHDALDLCFGCKACSSECPVSVDMATYKAEFLHKHYRRRIRPLSHYSMGWLPLWLRLARRAPRIANLFLGNRVLARLGGIDPHRAIPRLATNRRTPASRAAATGHRGPLTLWVDTFTASFDPDIADAALEVLGRAGFDVTVVGPDVCCGLTWVSTGQLEQARRVMGRAVAALTPTDGDIVVLEPSCAAALRGDLPELLQTAAAKGVSARIRTLADVMVETDLSFRPLDDHVVAQFHCHQRAVLGTDADRELMARLGATLTSVDEGCCGLAGNFGFEKGHYDISVTAAHQSFMPVLGRHPDSTVLADGFSCRLQVAEVGHRPTRHLAQLLRDQLTADDSA
ncbi:FAD-binding and (Fe-S)-binding domain-containing protein [Nocardioides sp.]|uniref:FAD-binding and (Fe-S)-binding domain-containing protein n=1 Tax=Nocardioides sp. TaxID=35761 RepID=UPI002BCD34A6|nr:FAD-binding and (Fe-S)-binding domain-containing protein [Nocardioides sp.]HXH77170.1 FAD-binding and (Fe-S)-binding domain-containing protein [Nocardioides sp.]